MMEVTDAAFLARQVQPFETRRAHSALKLFGLRLILRQRDMREMRLMPVADYITLVRWPGRRCLPGTHAHELLEIPQHLLGVARMRPMAEQPEMMRADVQRNVWKQKVMKIVQ